MRQFTDVKDPNDVDDFAFDWSSRLKTGETISSCAAAIVAGDATTLESGTVSGTTTIARVSGGTDGTTADVRFRITTSAGRQLDETGRILIRSR